MSQLRAQGIDAFLAFHADGFAPRQWQQYAYWQTVGIHLYSTHPNLKGNLRSYWGWVNTDNMRARSPSEAAVEIVKRMALFSSNPL
jgi:hypothetical protein